MYRYILYTHIHIRVWLKSLCSQSAKQSSDCLSSEIERERVRVRERHKGDGREREKGQSYRVKESDGARWKTRREIQ